MREILFRGKRKDNGEWVEGGFHIWETRQPCGIDDKLKPEEIKYMITVNSFADWNMPRNMQAVEIILETVGQYTGLTDKNGKKVFEGDIFVEAWSEKQTVYFDDCYMQYRARNIEGFEKDISYYGYKKIEVIGNIHDNPELLEV